MFVFFSARNIVVQQKTQLNTLKSLIKKVKIEKEKNSSIIWTNFCSFTKKWVFLCQTTEVYNRPCTIFLCVLFPLYITIICYFLYVVVFANQTIDLFQLAVLYFILANCNTSLFLLTYECTALVKQNNYCDRLTRRFVFEYGICSRNLKYRKEMGYINKNLHQLVKTDLFFITKRLHRYAFKVLAYYRITSKTYFSVII